MVLICSFQRFELAQPVAEPCSRQQSTWEAKQASHPRNHPQHQLKHSSHQKRRMQSQGHLCSQHRILQQDLSAMSAPEEAQGAPHLLSKQAARILLISAARSGEPDYALGAMQVRKMELANCKCSLYYEACLPGLLAWLQLPLQQSQLQSVLCLSQGSVNNKLQKPWMLHIALPLA